MAMSVVLYSIPQVIELMSATGAGLMNYPMNRTDFTVYRHADNDIDFRVRDIDRKAISFASATAVIHIMDGRQQRLVMARELIIHSASTGHLKLFMTGAEAAALPQRDLRYTVMMTRADGAQVMLFTDKNRTAAGVIHVEDGPLPAVIEPVRLTVRDFIRRRLGVNFTNTLFAGAFAGAKMVQNETGIHSLTIDLQNDFSGKVSVEGSKNPSPSQDDSDWSTVVENSYLLTTGNQYIEFTDPDLMWVRFRIEPRRGSFGDVVYRN